jgi:hypothetical protein
MEKNKNGIDMASEPLLTAVEPCVHTRVARPDLAYASVVDGVLQVTPDLQREIEEVDRGEVVSLNEFKTMFRKWID